MYKFIFLMLISTNVFADTNWLRVSANTVVVIDWLQTREISSNENYYETNNFLGRNPSQDEVNRYFLTLIASYNILGEILPEQYSDLVYFYATFEHGKAVIGNYNLGIKFDF